MIYIIWSLTVIGSISTAFLTHSLSLPTLIVFGGFILTIFHLIKETYKS